MRVFAVVRKFEYALIAALSAIIMASIYIYTQVLGNLQNVDLWITIIPWYNAALFIIFVALFGLTVSYQIYLWRQPKVCSINQKTSAAGTSSAATLAAFFVAQCPACASLSALLLPVGAATFLSKASTVINIISIALMLFTLYYLGAFKGQDT
ncbi:MAG: hypothetical protein HY514_05125 [Candidatus Aenigmarchaeota archaeon]|nr:hypothetical protein [Candidatus Aenigmarchaeota archaeon]